MMLAPLFAADWEAFVKIAVFLVVGLYYVISALAKKVQPQPPLRPRPIAGQPEAEAPHAGDPLQAEIDDFLRKAQSQREGRQEGFERPQQPVPEAPRRPRSKRRATGGSIRRQSPQRPPQLPTATPVLVEVVEADRPRESLAQQLAHRAETSVFDQRARPLSQMQQASDTEFQQHMQKVFDHQLGSLKPTALGMFEAAGAAAATAATDAATLVAAGDQTSTAPVTIHKGASDIALFLAGKKNIRDAIILSEVLNRPESRW
jgi:hypothetical protein